MWGCGEGKEEKEEAKEEKEDDEDEREAKEAWVEEVEEEEEELVENRNEVAEALSLKPLERKRLQKEITNHRSAKDIRQHQAGF